MRRFRRRNPVRTLQAVWNTAGSVPTTNGVITVLETLFAWDQILGAGVDRIAKTMYLHGITWFTDFYCTTGTAGNMWIVAEGAYLYQRSQAIASSPFTGSTFLANNQFSATSLDDVWPRQILYRRMAAFQVVAGSALTNNTAMWQPIRTRAKRKITNDMGLAVRVEISNQQTMTGAVPCQHSGTAVVHYSVVT